MAQKRQHQSYPIAWGIILSLIGIVMHLGVIFATTSTNSTCEPDWASDAYCDSSNNIEECGYDGGDCCGCSCEDTDDYFCGVNGFDCQDPDQASCDFGTNTTAACEIAGAYSDGHCEEVNNNEDCRFDGGDCCSCTCDPDPGACEVDDSTQCLDTSAECYPSEEDDDISGVSDSNGSDTGQSDEGMSDSGVSDAGLSDSTGGSDKGGSDSSWPQTAWEMSVMIGGAATLAIAAAG